jgi:hypothetical protein
VSALPGAHQAPVQWATRSSYMRSEREAEHSSHITGMKVKVKGKVVPVLN